MATLDVQPKKKSALPWILIVLILVAAAVIYYFMRDDANTEPANTPAQTNSPTTGGGNQPTQ